MRPLMLKISAFEAYANEQVLDFEKGLAGENFFLISGATGSGKTSILDAICFALYGESSGEEKNKAGTAAMLRSEMADPKTETFVEFKFALGDKIYRIKRTLGYSVDGKKSKQSSVFLYEVDDGRDNLLERQASSVKNKIIELLGFNAAQFRQVVVLPQGDFKRFLSATSKERQDLLNMIFKTDAYQIVADRLKKKAEDFRDEYRTLQGRHAGMLSECSAQDKADLELKIENAEKTLDERRENLEDLNEARKSRLDEFTAAKNLYDLFEDLITALKKIKADESKKLTVDEFKILLDQANRAVIVQEKEMQMQKSKEDCDKKVADSKRAKEEFDDIKEQYERTKASLESAEKEEELRKIIHLELAKLREYMQIMTDYLTLEQQGRAAGSRAVVAAKKYNKLSLDFAQMEKDIEKIESEARRLQTIVSGKDRVARVMDEWKRRQAIEARLQDLREAKDFIEHELTEKRKEIDAATMELTRARQHFSDILERRQNGRAAILAEGLEDGEPCPVCGAIHHPALAFMLDDIPTDEDFRNAERNITEFDEALKVIEQERQLINERLAKNSAETEAKVSELVSLPKSNMSYQDAAIERARIIGAENDLEQITRSLPIIKSRRDRLKKDCEVAAKERDEAKLSATKFQAEFDSKRSQIPEQYRDIRRVQSDIQIRENKLKESESAYNEAKANFNDVQHQYTILDSENQTAKKMLDEAAEKFETMRQEFETTLKDSGFESIEKYREALSGNWSSKKYRDEVQSRIDSYNQDKILHEKEAERAKEKVEEKFGQEVPANLEEIEQHKPDLEDMQKLSEDAEKSWMSGTESIASLQAEIEKMRQILEKLTALEDEIKAVEKNYSVAEDLSKFANGNKSPYNVSFQRYMLRALFLDVIDAANQRLNRMSQGRFLLRDSTKTKGNKSSGLDLEVYDEFSGTTRLTSSLSGGESFLAALALSLGMADVVGNNIGGIRLDTIFIDEGFGSLDIETLDTAIQTLMELQSGGRLVGIISHVEELKNRISTRIEIIKSNKGSRAVFVNL